MKATFTYDGKTYSSFNKLRFIQNAFGFDIEFAITDDAGFKVDLTGKTVSLELKDIVSSSKKTINLVLDTDPSTGKVLWAVAEGDLEFFSVFDSEITITTGTSAKDKFNVGLLTITQEL